MTIPINANLNTSPAFEQKHKSTVNNSFSAKPLTKNEFKAYYSNPEMTTVQKAGVFLATLAGVGIVMANILKGKGYSLSPAKILKTQPKNWGLLNVKYGEGEIEKLVMKLAAGSVGGGLIGGAMFDRKENMSAKYRESIIQVVGNILTPLACVCGGMKVYKNYKPSILSALPKKAIYEKLTKVIASGASLACGIILGNKVGNFINEKLFQVKDNRKLKLSDMSPHIDDLCLAVSLVGADVPAMPRIIPAALMIAGFSTGIAQEKPERLHKKAVEEPVT